MFLTRHCTHHMETPRQVPANCSEDGLFHTICNFLVIIGKRFLDAELRDLSVESEVIEEGSVDRVLNGQQYNRGVRLHKLLYEALAWKGFQNWLQRNQDAEQQCLLEDTPLLFVSLTQSSTQENLDSILQNPRLALLFDLFQNYLSFLLPDGGSLAQLWLSYTDMVETPLYLIRSSREGNWLLHLYAIRAVPPSCFTYDKINYSHYLFVYYAEMTSLS